LSEISAAVCSMDHATQQNAAMVEETSAAATNLSAKIQKMVEQAAVFRWERRERDVPSAAGRRRGDRRDDQRGERRGDESSTGHGGGERRRRELATA